jgi:hypothetical protein
MLSKPAKRREFQHQIAELLRSALRIEQAKVAVAEIVPANATTGVFPDASFPAPGVDEMLPIWTYISFLPFQWNFVYSYLYTKRNKILLQFERKQ